MYLCNVHAQGGFQSQGQHLKHLMGYTVGTIVMSTI